jgi:hypothetical protein
MPKSVWLTSAAACLIAAAPIGLLHATDATTSPSDLNARLDTLFGSHESVEQFLASLKADCADKRWPAIAAKIAYPLKTRIAGRSVTIRNPSEFIAHSEDLLTPKVVAAIERQAYASLFSNDRGVMIGDGEVWFSGVCEDAACKIAPVKIIAINP